jgi:hypothetical protein
VTGYVDKAWSAQRFAQPKVSKPESYDFGNSVNRDFAREVIVGAGLKA